MYVGACFFTLTGEGATICERCFFLLKNLRGGNSGADLRVLGRVVSGRGGGAVRAEGGGGVLEPVEPGGGKLGAAADVGGAGGVFAGHGGEYEEAV